MTPEATRRFVGRVETSALDQAMAEGSGAIVLSGHFGNWEIGGVLMRRLTPFPLSVVARAEASPAVARLRQQCAPRWRSTRSKSVTMSRPRCASASGCRRTRVVAMLIDRHLGKDSVEVSFFGRPTKFLRTPALLAALSGAPLVPCFVYRDEGRLAVECGPLIRVSSTGDRRRQRSRATQQVATLLEQHVRRHPQYWYQFYPFWTGATSTARRSKPKRAVGNGHRLARVVRPDAWAIDADRRLGRGSGAAFVIGALRLMSIS